MLSFDEIAKSITLEEFKTILLRGQYEQLKSHIPTEQINRWMHDIESEFSFKEFDKKKDMDSLFNIAYFARSVSQMHPGWNEWDKDYNSRKNKDLFKKSVENLYNQQYLLDRGDRLKGIFNLGKKASSR